MKPTRNRYHKIRSEFNRNAYNKNGITVYFF